MIALAFVVLLVSYTEPTTYTDGRPLTDLDHCNVYVDGYKLPDIPATDGAGGEEVTVTLGLLDVDRPITVTCTTAAGVESEQSEPYIPLLQ